MKYSEYCQCAYEQVLIALEQLTKLKTLMDLPVNDVEGCAVLEHLFEIDFAVGSAIQSMHGD